ncbi:ABC transporter substrate-binding protein [Deinococcus peraridilitoris]|uniref:ABC-type Fe3+-hydroxamate transport system, periplasmic component n=1 Tax=Deinococcus peraridilitoris (strain DSM 19664 / LMG 22246 / CIP 109416 / KR-200) TaxID=937777 RepID=L0A7W2_DEIPD|nr:iron-siderophore ABC transporter substrate-binding protein [Deinococcus peraridilitoris]AFZ69272.1 ABC-type Fe3+-hydroxamate transport system, periplasmic component [Deinococcus peraridilitoris DSM 19664]
MHKLLVTTLLALPGGALAQDANCEGRLIKHAMGDTCVPQTPKRVVVLDTGELDSTLALGVKPIGAVTALGAGFPSYLKGKTDGITDVGTIAQPNLEKILALKPDLILTSKIRHGNIYEQLSKIAPTVMAETVGVVWKDNLKLNAKALNREAQANKLLSNYYARAKKLQAGLGRDRLNTEVSIVRFVPGQTRLQQKASFIGTILEDAGLKRPKSQDKDAFMEVATPERIPDMDGGVLFYSTYGPAQQTDQQLYLQHPLWKRLNVVKEGRVHAVNDDYWFLGIGVIAANKVLDDLEQHLGKR